MVLAWISWAALSAIPFMILGGMGVMPWEGLNVPMSTGLHVPVLTERLPYPSGWLTVVTLINATFVAILVGWIRDAVLHLRSDRVANASRSASTPTPERKA